jgi:hypothetical protein
MEDIVWCDDVFVFFVIGVVVEDDEKVGYHKSKENTGSTTFEDGRWRERKKEQTDDGGSKVGIRTSPIPS